MNGKPEIFYAKIMLFGEYSVICDSMGLTIPYAHFTGELSFINDEQYTEYEFALESNHHLRAYFSYIRELHDAGKMLCNFNISQFEEDIEHGLYFESNIPQGYGIGSSGALVAALYHQYAVSGMRSRKVLTSSDILKLKEIFSQLESYFHGVSSGIDPLLCYIRYPLLIRSRNEIETVGIPRNKFDKNGAIFLVDTGRTGMTGPLVNLFFERCNDEDFMDLVSSEFIPANNGCINALLKGDMKSFFNFLKKLSRFQYKYLPEMIPDDFKKYWKIGLEGDQFKMKLCGSGGGGFLLGIARNYDETRKFFEKEGVDPILVYRNA